jgi:hypothetical protein
MPHFYSTCAGPIEGLYLPPIAWEVLRREDIGTVDQLRAHAHRIEQLDGIEAGMAQFIRQAALAHFARPYEPPLDKTPYGSWGA